MTRKLAQAKPVGMLYSQGREYFLLFASPLPPAEWQAPGTDRFLVVPNKDLTGDYKLGELNVATYKPEARHIVTNAYCIDYMWGSMPNITMVESVLLKSLDDLQLDFWNSIMDEEESELAERLEDLQIQLPV